MKTIPEPANRSIALFCHPITGTPEDAWVRDDAAAAEGGYDAQNWYPIGRIMEDPPETWVFLTRDTHKGDKILVVTGTSELTPGTISA